MAYMDSLAAPEKRRYREKLQVLYNSNDSGVLVDPYSVEDNVTVVDDYTASATNPAIQVQ